MRHRFYHVLGHVYALLIGMTLVIIVTEYDTMPEVLWYFAILIGCFGFLYISLKEYDIIEVE